MINRRLLRIKVLQIVYAHLKASREKTLDSLDKELQFSVEKSHDFYVMVFKLLGDMHQYACLRLEQIQNRHIKNTADAIPYQALVNNAVLQLLNKSRNLSLLKPTWIEHSKLVKEYTDELLASGEFRAYIAAEKTIAADKEIVTWFLAEQFLEKEALFDYLEEHSLYWNDEPDSIVTMNVRAIERIDAESADISIQKMFKDDEIKEFARRLLRKAVFNFNDNNTTLERFLKNWDVERIAEIDLLVLHLALTEAVECPSIPTKVTMDEYIEISKLYGTEKSANFINGILNVMFKQLADEGTIVKVGRGLVE